MGNVVSKKETVATSEKALTVAIADPEINGDGLEVSNGIKIRQLGVWTMYERASNHWSDRLPTPTLWTKSGELVAGIPFLKRFAVDCFSLGPRLFTVWIVASTVSSFFPAAQLWLSGRLLSSIQQVLEDPARDPSVFYAAAASSISCALLNLALDRYTGEVKRQMEQRIKRHFEEWVMRVHIRLDLPTIEDAVTEGKLTQITADWRNHGELFSSFISIASTVLRIGSQFLVVQSALHEEPSGGLLSLVLMTRPLLMLVVDDGWPSRYYAIITNMAYKRLRSLAGLAQGRAYHRDMISDGLQEYITEEYKATASELGDIPDVHVTSQMCTSSPVSSILGEISHQLPTIVFGVQCIRSRGSVSLKSFSLLGDVTSNLTWALWDLQYQGRELINTVQSLRTMYEAMDIPNQIVDGPTPYPLPDAPKDGGMKIEFKNVSFRYPKADKTAISEMSFTIQSGDIVVIVGENGCGKSSTVKLLSRLYDVTEGEILIDDRPMKDYKSADLQRAGATFYQDYVRYSTTLRYNIGFGAVEHKDDNARVERAAELGGALGFIKEQRLGFETDVGDNEPFTSLDDTDPDDPLNQFVRKFDKAPKFSGGQWQRLALARNFMRLERDGTRFLCYDEPSASLDPTAEYELFEKLRKMKGDRTMVFITHRFGHLTKYANQIFYMDKGNILERGTHAELMAQDGEYARLYKIQASAYTDSDPSASNTMAGKSGEDVDVP